MRTMSPSATVVGLDTALVYPHLAAADRLIDVRLGHAFAQPQQVIVQALAGMFGVDLDHPDGGGLQEEVSLRIAESDI